jgi:hypothetical protein
MTQRTSHADDELTRAYCSMACPIHPLVRPIANIGSGRKSKSPCEELMGSAIVSASRAAGFQSVSAASRGFKLRNAVTAPRSGRRFLRAARGVTTLYA